MGAVRALSPAPANPDEPRFFFLIFGDERLPGPTKVQVLGGERPSRQTWVHGAADVEAFGDLHRDTRGAVCYCPAVFGSEQDCEANVTQLCALVLDFDGKDYVEKGPEPCRGAMVSEALVRLNRAEKLLGKATGVVYSGNGIHGLWVFEKPLQIDDTSRRRAKRILRATAERMEADTACATLSHYYRIPGTLNAKSEGAIRTKVLAVRSEARITYEFLESIADPVRKPKSSRKLPGRRGTIRPFHVLRRLAANGSVIRPAKKPGSWMAMCPAHNDQHPSLSIRTDAAGKAMVKCFAGCSTSDVLESLDLKDGSTATGDGKQSAATAIVELLEDVELFHAEDGSAYATIDVIGHRETMAIDSDAFSGYVAHRTYDELGRVPPSQAINDTLRVLGGRARHEGPQQPVFLRVGHHEGSVYLDLGDESWTAIEITAGGWKQTQDCPVKFRRGGGTAPLPRPERGGSLDLLRPLLNLEDDAQWALVQGCLVSWFRPRGPYSILIFTGEQGSAKSTTQRLLRDLVDPHVSDAAFRPKSIEDLILLADDSHLLSFDNFSHLDQQLGDALCRISTGGVLSKRKLYRNRELEHIKVERPVVINSIAEIATQSDVLDRAILLELPPILGRRKPIRALREEFERLRPLILGALLDAVSTALAREQQFELIEDFRLADFAKWVQAAEPALDCTEGAFLTAYAENREDSREIALESSPVIVELLRFLRSTKTGSWSGTMTDLLRLLESRSDDSLTRSRAWPRSGRGMSNALKRAMPDLRAHGYKIDKDRANGGNRERMVFITRPSAPPSGGASTKPVPLFPTEPTDDGFVNELEDVL